MKMFEASSSIKFPEAPPGPPGAKWAASDRASWQDIIRPADYVRATCPNGVGYGILGRELGVGVMIWGVDTVWDRFIRALVVGNGTVEMADDDTS